MDAPNEQLIQYLSGIAQQAFQGKGLGPPQTSDPALQALFHARWATAIHGHASVAVVLLAYDTLPDPSAWHTHLLAFRTLLPWGAFVVFAADCAHTEALAVSFGAPDPVWTSRGTPQLSLPERPRILEAFRQADDPVVLAAELACILETREPGSAFYRAVARSVDRCTTAWCHGDALAWAERRELAILFVARLMFVFFVQHKGWLPHRQYLQHTSKQTSSALYKTWLQPLFFDALNKHPDERVSGVIPRDVPYLNGGLFAPHALELAHPELELPDEVARLVIQHAFAPFRFVDDEAATDHNSVRPHMLGEVFERLMCGEERQQTGAFYTPAPLAEALAEDALLLLVREHLGNGCADALRDDAPLARDDALALQRYLPTLRIFDPAVGTGAFLLACLLQLEAWLLRCASADSGVPPDRPALRQHLITHCLHGVDIQPTAVLLAELRLWLSLASVLPNHRDGAIPLPNLEHRLRVGDSLRPGGARMYHVPDSDAGDDARRRYDVRSALQAELRAALQSFSTLRGRPRHDAVLRMRTLESALSTLSAVEERTHLHAVLTGQTTLFSDAPLTTEQLRARQRLRDMDADQERASSSADTGGFQAQLHFADVMQEGGFDLVIANPPWLSLARVPQPKRGQLRRGFKVLHSSGTRAASADLSVAFFEQALTLLKPNGRAAFLLPAKVLRAAWGQPFRALLQTDCEVECVEALDTHSTHGFRASAYPARVIVRPRGSGARLLPRWEGGPDEAAGGLLTPHFADRHTIRYGIKTGANRVFVDPPDAIAPTVPAVRGRDLKDGAVRATCRLLFAHDSATGKPLAEVNTVVAGYLREAEAVLRARSDWRQHEPDWCVYRIYPESFGWRVAWPDIAQRMMATVLAPLADGGPLCMNTVYYVGVEDEAAAVALAAWLNADAQQAWLRDRAQVARNGYFRFDARTVGALRLPAAADATATSAGRCCKNTNGRREGMPSIR